MRLSIFQRHTWAIGIFWNDLLRRLQIQPKPFPLCLEELKATAEHVAYEMDMLRFSAFQATNQDQGWVKNLSLESFQVHARNLLEFFHTKKNWRYPKDVRVSDYVEPLTWKGKRPDWTKRYMKKCSKLVSHITSERDDYVQKNDKVVEFSLVLPHLESMWVQFTSVLPGDRKTWFRTKVNPPPGALGGLATGGMESSTTATSVIVIGQRHPDWDGKS